MEHKQEVMQYAFWTQHGEGNSWKTAKPFDLARLGWGWNPVRTDETTTFPL